MADEFDQFKTNKKSGDEFDQFKVAKSSPKAASTPKDTRSYSLRHPLDSIELFGERHPYVSSGVLGGFSGVGIPESKTPVTDLAKGTAATFKLGPNEGEEGFDKVMSYVPIYGPLYRMGKGLVKQTAEFGKEVAPAAAALNIPGYNMTQDQKLAAVHGAAGLTTEVLSLLWGGKKGEAPFDEAKVNRMAAATGAYPEDLKTVQHDLEGAAKTQGKPKTAAELRDLTRTALDTNTAEFSQALQPIASKKVVPTQIADAIRKKITPEMMMDPDGRQMAKELRREAKTYDKTWTLRDLYQRKQRFDAEGSSFYKKTESGRSAALKTSVDEIVENAVREGVKDIVYPQMDVAAKKPSGYFRDLQLRQSSLIKVRDAATATVKELGKQDAAIKGMPLVQKVTKKASLYAHPLSGRGGISLHKLNEPIGVSKLSFADAATRSAFARHPVEAAVNAAKGVDVGINASRARVTIPRTDRKQLPPLQ